MLRPFAEVDVFTTEPYRGNPVAVVLDGGGLSDVGVVAPYPPGSPEAFEVRAFTYKAYL